MGVQIKRIAASTLLLVAAACNSSNAIPTAPGADRGHARFPATQQGFVVLHSFQGPPSDGYAPLSGLVAAADGTLFGDTSYGGSGKSKTCGDNGCGTFYKMSGNSDSVLYSFVGPPSDGTDVAGGLAGVNGAYYGATIAGGPNGLGTIFQIKPSRDDATKWTESVIYTFKGPPDGSDPGGAHIIADSSGALYGTTFMGGSATSCLFGAAGCGTVFKLTPPSGGKKRWQESVLHSFTGQPDGAGPGGDLLWAGGGAIYGTTDYGGTSTQCPYLQGCGTLYQLSPRGKHAWTSMILHSFNVGGTSSSDGSLPSGSLALGPGGVLYGTTAYGGGQGNCDVEKGLEYCGTFFEFTPQGRGKAGPAEQILYAFKGGTNDGAQPLSFIAHGKHKFYGVTDIGGNGPCQAYEGCGTIYELTPGRGNAPWKERLVHAFTDTDGAFPGGELVIQNGTLYGTTNLGGTGSCSFGCGTIYELQTVP